MFLNSAHLRGRSGAGRLLFTTVALIILSALAIAITFTTTNAQDDNTLIVGVPAPVNLDPATGTNDQEILINRAIYDYLIDIAPDGSLVPQLASDWAISEDGLTYDLTLVEGVSFHDGSDFTSEDVVFTFNRLVELGSPALALLGNFEVAANGDFGVTFTLPEPNADFLFGVASRWSLVLSAGSENVNVLDELSINPFANFNGTGPFILDDFEPGESITLEANDEYWIEGQPSIGALQLIYFESPEAELNALRSGTVDFIFKVPFDRVGEIEGEDGLNVIIKATNQHPVIRLRSDEGALGEDARVRQAFRLATDRELLNLDLFDGNATVGNNNPIGPLYGPFYAPLDEAFVYDPQAACDLLAEAGFPDGLGADDPIEFYVVDAFNYEEMAVLLQDMWSEGCINVEILLRPENIYYGNGEWLDVDLGVTGWGSRPIPQQYFLEAYITGALPTDDGGGFNESRFSDSEVDDLVAQAGVTADIETRAAIYNDIALIFEERGPIIVPFFAPIVGVANDRVGNLDMHPFAGRTDFRTVTLGQ